MSNELRNEIIKLEKELHIKKNKLFLLRLEKIAGISLENTGISDIKIVLDENENTWNISYNHFTNAYSIDNYRCDNFDSDLEDDSDDNNLEDYSNIENNTVEKKSKISFGKLNKYFINGNIKLLVYRNSTGELRIINQEYEFDLDLDQQRKLMEKYSENTNIPEWFAIKVLLFFSHNKWDDKDIITHLSIV